MKAKFTLIILLIILFNSLNISAQQELSLHGFMLRIDSVWPTAQNTALNTEIVAYQLKNAKNIWKPDLLLNGLATYQSSTIELDLSLPMGDLEVPSPDKDQYKIYLEAKQILYDGGTSKAQKALINQKAAQTDLVLNAEINKAKKAVVESYFALLELQQNEAILQQTTQDLQTRLKTLSAALANGIAGEVELEKLKIQEIKLAQSMYELKKMKFALSQSLSKLLETEIDTSMALPVPEIAETAAQLDQTLAYKQIQNNIEELKAQQKVLQSTRNPKIAAFVQGGYGKPGLNMLSNEFQPYYIAGVQAQWKIWDFSHKNNISMLEVQQKSLSNAADAYLQSISAQEARYKSLMEKYDYLIKRDLEIVVRQDKVLQTTNLQLEKGIISSADYLQELFAYAQAKLNLELHKIQKVKAMADYQMLNDLYQF